MKRLLLFLILITLLIVSASAHSGRTDANGGHWDRKNGTYHYHSGPHAGQSSSSSSTYVPPATIKPTPTRTPAPTPTPTPIVSETPEPDSENNPSLFETLFVFIFSGGFLLVPFFIFVLYSIWLYIYSPFDDYIYCAERLKDGIKEMFRLKRLVSSDAKPQIPEAYEIGPDNLPKDKGSSGWGDTFTLYYTRHGSKLHSKLGCCGASIPKHIYACIKSVFKYSLCSKCCKSYKIPDMKWYQDYLEYNNSSEKLSDLMRLLVRERTKYFALYKKCNSKFYKFLLLFNKSTRSAVLTANELHSKLVKH